jgi:MYXO-CTERM domain-containing protein
MKWGRRLLVVLGFAGGALVLPRAARAQGFSISTTSGLEAVRSSRASDWWLSGAGLIDLDGDGDLDVFLSSHGSYGSLTAVNDGKGHFSLGTGTFPKSELLLPADVDNDGKVDFTATYTDGGAQWWLMQSMPGSVPGQFSFLGTKVTRDGGQARQQALMDFDGDGKLDWLRGAGAGVLVDIGDGKGGFVATPARTIAQPGGEEISIVPVDVDGDGDQDLFVEWGRYDTYGPDGATRLYRNDGGGAFTNVTAAAGLTEMGLAIQGVGDFDQDGDTDFIALEKRAFPNSIFLNDGHGVFTKKAGAITGMATGTAHYASWGLAAMTDFDNDGIPDVIVDGRNYLKVLRGTGGGSFEYVNKTWGGILDIAEAAVDNGFAFGDIDGDGDLDLIGYKTIEPRYLNVYVNGLPARNWVNVRAVGLPGNKAAAGAEIRVFAPGTNQLLWYEEISLYSKQVQQNYYAMGDTERHIGLGSRATVDVTVRFHPSNKVVRRDGVAANSTVRISEDGAGTIVPPPQASPDAGGTTTDAGAAPDAAKPAPDAGAAGAGGAGTGAAGTTGNATGAAGTGVTTGAAGEPATTGAAGTGAAAGAAGTGAAGAAPQTGAAGASVTGTAGTAPQAGGDAGCSCGVGDGGAAPVGALLLLFAGLLTARRARPSRVRATRRSPPR